MGETAGDDTVPTPDEAPSDDAAPEQGSSDDAPSAADDAANDEASEESTDDGAADGSSEAPADQAGEPDAGTDATDPAEALAAVKAQRDDLLATLQRVKADFDNHRKRTEKDRITVIDRAAEDIVRELLPALDACDAAVAHGDEGVAAIRTKLFEVLGKNGLETMDSVGEQFDPQLHEAVMRESGEGEADEVLEIMRAGYTWRGRVVRPAMVKVRG